MKRRKFSSPKGKQLRDVIHSAGAHLVYLTGTSNLFLPIRSIPLNIIKGVASIDTEGYDVAFQCNDNNTTYLNAFGNTNTNWVQASPISQLVLGTPYPKFFVAKRGTVQRIAISDAFISYQTSMNVFSKRPTFVLLIIYQSNNQITLSKNNCV